MTWIDSANGAFAYLALRQKGDLDAASSGLAASLLFQEFHQYERQHWLDPVGGSDVVDKGRGSIAKPWRTFQAWANFWGPPRDVDDFEKTIYLNVLGDGADSPDQVTLPPSRRMVIRALGAFVPSITWTVNGDSRFGSSYVPELAIIGEASAGLFALPFRRPVTDAQVGLSTGIVPSIAVTKVGLASGNHILHLVNATIQNEIVNTGFAALEAAWLLEGTSLLGAVNTFANIWRMDDCILGAAGALNVNQIISARDCLISKDIVVLVAPEPTLTEGFRGCRFNAAASWTGPAASLRADYTTRFWIAANAVPVTAGAGAFIESQVVWP